MSHTIEVDVVVVGGGMVGLLFALLLARQQFTVALIESQKEIGSNTGVTTPRVSAINVSVQNLLKKLDVWHHINPARWGRLERLVVWDSVAGGEVTFDAADAGQATFGSIVENREIIRVLHHALQHKNNVQMFAGVAPCRVELAASAVELTLDNQQKIRASLCVGADGADSWLRQNMQINVRQRSYQQTAIIASVTTERAHQATAWQVFLPTGPLALLPLDNQHHCSMVWSAATVRARELLSMDAGALADELTSALGGRLGEITVKAQQDGLATAWRHFPLHMRHVEQYVKPRLALMGDAAHTIHPLAGQGANLGFMDAWVLAECLMAARRENVDIGQMKYLRRYERARKADNTQMSCAMRGLNDLFGSSSLLAIQLRSQGLNIVNRSRSLKKYFVDVAVGIK